MSRAFGWLIVVALLIAAIGGIAASQAVFYHSAEDRLALHALRIWKEHPSPETEMAWIAARDRARRTETRFRVTAFSAGALAGVAATLLSFRLARSSQRKSGEVA